MITDPAAPIRLRAPAPLLMVVVDTEEEFDWSAPFDRARVGVGSIGAQHLAQDIFAPHGLRPTYAISYPVATTPSSIAVLRALRDAGRCQIGAHLHTWVTPPFDEAVSARNSFAGNLDPALERAKLRCLTEAIAAAFGAPPTIYKAGRYGVGPGTADSLRALGYQIDLSALPHTNLTSIGGPDFRRCTDRPAWIGPAGGLLEIPMGRARFGPASRWGNELEQVLHTPSGRLFRLPGIISRLGVLNKATLTPEGADFATLRRLARAMLRQGHEVFTLSYHSPSLVPGNTPYVRDAADLERFLDTLRRVCAFFMDELGAQPTTPHEVRALALAATSEPVT